MLLSHLISFRQLLASKKAKEPNINIENVEDDARRLNKDKKKKERKKNKQLHNEKIQQQFCPSDTPVTLTF